MASKKTKERRNELDKQTVQAVEELGGSMCAALVVSHYVQIGEGTAEKITAEQIAAEVKKQQEEEEKAAAAGLVCLMSADFVRWLLESVAKFAKMSAAIRSRIIKKYL